MHMTLKEHDLVAQMKSQVLEVSRLDEALTLARQKLEFTKQQLIEVMTSQSKERTATYEGIGFVSLMRPKVRARVLKENESLLFEFLASVGRDDIIKETVNAHTLSSFVKERLENGEEVPDFINYYLQPDVRLYIQKGD